MPRGRCDLTAGVCAWRSVMGAGAVNDAITKMADGEGVYHADCGGGFLISEEGAPWVVNGSLMLDGLHPSLPGTGAPARLNRLGPPR
eukprot:SAG11_NODE_134_length_15338_cov_3.876435_4_plen_87_part_00